MKEQIIYAYLEGYFDAHTKPAKRFTSKDWERLYHFLHRTLMFEYKIEMSFIELQPCVEYWLERRKK